MRLRLTSPKQAAFVAAPLRVLVVCFGLASLVVACGDDSDSTTGSGGNASTTGTTVVGSTSNSSASQGGGGQGGAGVGGAGVGGGGSTLGTCGLPTQGNEPNSPVRIVAANLSSGNNQGYDGGHGVRILQGLDADVVLLQEMNFGNNSEAAITDLVQQICEGPCAYRRGPAAQIPNGVISRLPMLACGSWVDPEVDNRSFVWARIDVPGQADLWAISVHLLSTGATKRNEEAAALLGAMAGLIPPSDLVVIGGDLNTDNRNEAALTTLGALFQVGGPYPADQNGNTDTNGPRNKPYDWLLSDTELSATATPVVIGSTTFPAGAVIDTRIYTPLAEVAPAQSSDSGASGMQHMAVVKDFDLVEDDI